MRESRSSGSVGARMASPTRRATSSPTRRTSGICEMLGVKFPGPTRQIHPSSVAHGRPSFDSGSAYFEEWRWRWCEIAESRGHSCRTRQRIKTGGRHHHNFWQENAPAAFLSERFPTEREPQAQAAGQDRAHILDRCNQADV